MTCTYPQWYLINCFACFGTGHKLTHIPNNQKL